MPRGDHRTARLHRDWLQSIVSRTGTPPTTLAKVIGVAPSTLTRPLKEGDLGTSTLHATTIDKIVSYTGLPGPLGETSQAVFAPKTVPNRWGRSGFGEETLPFDTSAETALAGAVRAMIAGREHVLPVVLQTRALEVAGYLPGDVLIYDLNGQPNLGDVVRAQVYDRNGEIEETVWRIFSPPVLIGLTRDPSLLPKPLIVDNDRVVVMGTVIGMIRPQSGGQRAA